MVLPRMKLTAHILKQKDVLPYFIKIEDRITERWNTTAPLVPNKYRGKGGLLPVTDVQQPNTAIK